MAILSYTASQINNLLGKVRDFNSDELSVDVKNAIAVIEQMKNDAPEDLDSFAEIAKEIGIIENLINANKDNIDAMDAKFALKEDIPSLEGYAKAEDIPSLEGYAKVEDIPAMPDMKLYALKEDIPAMPDMSPYALKEDIPAMPDMSPYALKEDIPAMPDMSPYAKVEDIPSLDEYAKLEDMPDMSPYAKAADVDARIEALVGVDSSTAQLIQDIKDAMEADNEAAEGVHDILDAAIAAKVSHAAFDAKMSEVDAAMASFQPKGDYLTEHQDLSDYAKVADLDNYQPKGDYLTEHQDLSDYAMKADIPAMPDMSPYAMKSEIPSVEGFVPVSELEALQAKYDADMLAMKKIIGAIGGDVKYDIFTYDQFKDIVKASGTMMFQTDFDNDNCGTTKYFYWADGMTAKNTMKFNMNGHNIIANGREGYGMLRSRGSQNFSFVGKGTIECLSAHEGTTETVKFPVFVATDSSYALFNSSTLTVKTNDGNPAVICTDNATIDIKLGTFVANNPSVIYALGVAGKMATINISGGNFRSTYINKEGNPDSSYLINMLDGTRANGKIVVTGGKFYDFNPADCKSEGANTCFIPFEEVDGERILRDDMYNYSIVEGKETIDDREYTTYTVKKTKRTDI